MGFHGRAIWREVRLRRCADLRRHSASLQISAVVFLVVVLAVVNAGFLFNGSGTSLAGYNMLTGVAGTPDTFRWLRDNFTPVGHIAHAVLVYEVSAAELDRVVSRPQPAPTGR